MAIRLSHQPLDMLWLDVADNIGEMITNLVDELAEIEQSFASEAPDVIRRAAPLGALFGAAYNATLDNGCGQPFMDRNDFISLAAAYYDAALEDKEPGQ